jgi:hypothetical protein
MRRVQAPHNTGVTVRDVLEYYRCYLSRNRDLANHCTQFLKRECRDPKAAQAEAVVFSWLWAEKLKPCLFEDAGTGGPDFCCTHSGGNRFIVEATSLDSEMVSERSGLPTEITGPGGRAFALITEKLKAKAKSKASQLAGHGVPTVLAITSDHAFAGLLMDQLAAEYLMTSAPQTHVPIGGGPSYITHDFKDAVFRRNTGLVWASGAPIVKPALRSIGAILLIAVGDREMRIVGLLHPDAANLFNPKWLPMIPFVKFTGLVTFASDGTEWLEAIEGHRKATFPHRHIR